MSKDYINKAMLTLVALVILPPSLLVLISAYYEVMKFTVKVFRLTFGI